MLIWWLEILEKRGARFLAFQRHRCNACTVISWQSAFLWMHLHCQALAYTIKRSLLALKLLGMDFFIRFHIEHCNVVNDPRDLSSVATCNVVNDPRDLSSVATCNVVNDPRDLSSMAIYHVRSTRNVNMPPHPTPPHNRDIQKRAFYGNGFRSADIYIYIFIYLQGFFLYTYMYMFVYIYILYLYGIYIYI